MAKRITPRHIEAVDDLGRLKARISKLKEDEAELKKFLLASGHDEIDGKKFRVTLIRTDRIQVAWKRIAEKLGASKQLIAGNTTTIPVESVKVVARKTS